LEFGNFGSGNFTLENPTAITLSQDSKIFVLDENFLTVFDQYGMGLIKIKLKYELKKINNTYNNLILSSSDSLYYQNLKKPISKFKNITPKGIPKNENIIESLIFNKQLYILTETKILIFSIIN